MDATTVTAMIDELRLTMLASTASSGLARTLVQQRLSRWGYMHISCDVLLATAELVANASEATPGREIKIRFSRDSFGVLLEVWDCSDQVPITRPLIEPTLDDLDLREEHWDDNGGWGLPIVAALAHDCGYTPDPSGGKWVWARLKG
jgi:anti-sigma regulatory factor (Ser/Thr protein kinase)